jgi:hypothetical protein
MPVLLGKFRLDKLYYGLPGLIITALFLTFGRSIVISTASFSGDRVMMECTLYIEA